MVVGRAVLSAKPTSLGPDPNQAESTCFVLGQARLCQNFQNGSPCMYQAHVPSCQAVSWCLSLNSLHLTCFVVLSHNMPCLILLFPQKYGPSPTHDPRICGLAR